MQINSDEAPDPVGACPDARKVGNLLFLSGIGPSKKGVKESPGVTLDQHGNVQRYDIEQQCHAVFQNRISSSSIESTLNISKIINLAVLRWRLMHCLRRLLLS